MHRTSVRLLFGLIASLPSASQAPAPPLSPADLLGKPFAAALARFGPPERGDGTGGCVVWWWRDEGGGYLRLCVHDEHVVHVDEHQGKGAPAVRGIPTTGFYPGQSVAELLERLGNPLRAGAAKVPAFPGAMGQHAGPGTQLAAIPVADALLVFADARLYVSAGRVLGAAPLPEAGYGPR